MKALRCFLGGLVFGIIAQIAGGIIYGVIFPNWYSIETVPGLLRSMNHAGFKVGLPVMNIVQGLLLSFVYTIFYKGIPGKSPVTKGASFGFLLWLAGALPGVLISFCTTSMRFPLPCLMHTLAVMMIGSLIIGVIWGKSLEAQR